MAKDPICGMEVMEERSSHMIHFEHETIYFCSSKCKETYAQQPGMKKTKDKKGFFARFLEKLAKGNEQTYGGKPPRCH
jgi:YHS domain-containing protein